LLGSAERIAGEFFMLRVIVTRHSRQDACRCKRRLHGAKRKTGVARDDPRAAAFYCHICGTPARLNRGVVGKLHRRLHAALEPPHEWAHGH
jgi:hypothetical protein